MSKKFAFLFPGQGAQEPGMMKDICDAFPTARKTLDKISEIAGINVPELLWNSDAAVLSRSDNSQLALIGATPLEVEITKGAHNIVLRKEGYEPYISNVTIAAAQIREPGPRECCAGTRG